MIDFDELVGCVVGGDEGGALALTRRAMESGVPAREILERGLVRALELVGGQVCKWLVSQVICCTVLQSKRAAD